MLHSQQLNSSPLSPWVTVENNGKVLSGHCTCMARLAEVCTYVAALLFWVEMSIFKNCNWPESILGNPFK